MGEMPGITAERSFFVSTMVYYGRAIARKRRNLLLRKLAEYRIQVSAGLTAPLVTEGQVIAHLYRKVEGFLFGEKVPKLFALEADASGEDKEAFEAFKQKVMKSPLFWTVAVVSLLAERKVALLTLDASKAATQAIREAKEAHISAAFDTFTDYAKTRSFLDNRAQDTFNFSSIRAFLHERGYVKERRKRQKTIEAVAERSAAAVSREVKKGFMEKLSVRMPGAAKMAGGSFLIAFGAVGLTQGPLGWFFGGSSILIGRRFYKEGYYELIKGKAFPRRKSRRNNDATFLHSAAVVAGA